MSRRRFYAPPRAFDDNNIITLAPDETRHLRDVLRLGRGDEVFVFDGEGREYRCIIEECGRESARLRVCEDIEPARPESSLHLTLAVALLKGEKFDLVVQKATELGATRIMPLETKHADVRVRDEADSARRVKRWQRIALEAAKQSGRTRLTQIDAPVPFATLIENTAFDQAEARLMFAERGGRSLAETINRWTTRPQSVTALVGSEGGWSDEEIALARDAVWNIVTLGGRTLRAETAAITIAALLQHLFGDLS